MYSVRCSSVNRLQNSSDKLLSIPLINYNDDNNKIKLAFKRGCYTFIDTYVMSTTATVFPKLFINITSEAGQSTTTKIEQQQQQQARHACHSNKERNQNSEMCINNVNPMSYELSKLKTTFSFESHSIHSWTRDTRCCLFALVCVFSTILPAVFHSFYFLFRLKLINNEQIHNHIDLNVRTAPHTDDLVYADLNIDYN